MHRKNPSFSEQILSERANYDEQISAAVCVIYIRRVSAFCNFKIMRFVPAVFLFLSCVCVYGLTIIDSTLASSCIYYLAEFDYGCTATSGHMSGWGCRCHNVEWLGSITNCLHGQSEDQKEIDHAIQHVIKRCQVRAGVTYTPQEMDAWYRNASSQLHFPTLQDKEREIHYPLSVNQTDYAYYLSSFQHIHHHVEKSQWLGWGLNFYWVAIITVATLFRLAKRHIQVPNFVKRHIMLTSMEEKWPVLAKVSPIRLPTTLQGIILSGFTIQAILSTALSYTVPVPNAYINDRYLLTLDLIGYRTALLAFSLFPSIYFFGIRNNPFSVISGISFAEFNVYHQYISVVMAIEALIHSSIWTSYAMRTHSYQMYAAMPYWQWGIVGTVLVFLILFQSHPLFRKCSYEFFLKMHQLFALLFIVAMWYHCIDMGWMGWVYSMVGVWCFDRVCRLTRIVASGGLQTAVLRKHSGKSDVIQVTLQKPKLFKYYPGCYCYIYFADPWYKMWQSHPFTLIESESDLVVYFKVHKGLTKSLSSGIGEKGLTTKIIMEGPYGVPIAPRHTKVVGIAGGLGVTAVYQSLVKKSATSMPPTESSDSSSSSKLEFKESTQSCANVLYWVINDVSQLDWFEERLALLRRRGCQIKVLVTDPSEISSEKDVVNIGGRPDLATIVSQEISLAQDSVQDVDFVVCGPVSLSNDVKQQVSNCMPETSKISIRYHEENMTW